MQEKIEEYCGVGRAGGGKGRRMRTERKSGDDSGRR